ncbi:MAG: hypothetical protein EA397_05195 [Deltaproteobacteria bacterium]|nr:MAG: hypothetical protein EA397_05195 [Deltaproteobacteria bacterium]
MTRSSLLLSALLCAPLLPVAALAAPENVREVTLNDGRVLYGEVVTTEPSGVRLRVPQGDIIVPFHQLQNMQSAMPERYDSQRPWEFVVVGPETEREWVERALRTIPQTFVSGDQGKPSALSTSLRKTAQSCAPSDLQCAMEAVRRDDSWQWIVTVEPGQGGTATLRARATTDGGGGVLKVDDISDPTVLLSGLDRLLNLRAVPDRNKAISTIAPHAPATAPKERKPRRSTSGAGASSGALAAFVPVPGYTALKDGDMKGFGMAMAVTLPVTAAWVGVTGGQSQSAPEHIAMSAGGFYLTTVVVNQIFGVSSSGPTVGLSTTPSGQGAQVGFSMPLK